VGYFIVFFACQSGQVQDPIQEEPHIVVRGEMLSMHIKFCSTKCRFYPGNDIFEDPLQKLMEDIRSDQPEDVEVGKECPEWTIHRFHTCIDTGSYELGRVSVCKGMCCQKLFNVTEMDVNRIGAKLIIQYPCVAEPIGSGYGLISLALLTLVDYS
jgi:hypothetical protein